MTEFRYRVQALQSPNAQGFCVERIEDNQPLTWRRLPASHGLRAYNLVGERYRLESLQSHGFAAGSPLTLVREPSNPHDPNAVSVWDLARENMAGYIPASEVGPLAKKLDAGEEFRAYCMWEYWREGKRQEVRVLVLGANAEIELPTDPTTPLPFESPRQVDDEPSSKQARPRRKATSRNQGCLTGILAALVLCILAATLLEAL